MPIKRCGKDGWQYGDSGQCYTGPDAKKKAIKQGIAIDGPKKFSEKAYTEGAELYEKDIQWAASCMYEERIHSLSDLISAVATLESVNGWTEELTEDNFYVPASEDYYDGYDQDEDVVEWDIATEEASLWENIRKKKEREGKNYKPAKRGDKDRPDPDAWKRAQGEKEFKPHKMYDKDGKPHLAKTVEDHLRMKKMGYTHNDCAFCSEADYIYEDTKTGEKHRYNHRGDHRKDGRPLLYKGKAAEYQGRKVTLNKPFRTPSGPKKSAVYVKNGSGKVVIVRFGDPNMKIKKNIPNRRKNFRARHNCSNPGPKWKARYWSCRAW